MSPGLRRTKPFIQWVVNTLNSLAKLEERLSAWYQAFQWPEEEISSSSRVSSTGKGWGMGYRSRKAFGACGVYSQLQSKHERRGGRGSCTEEMEVAAPRVVGWGQVRGPVVALKTMAGGASEGTEGCRTLSGHFLRLRERLTVTKGET